LFAYLKTRTGSFRAALWAVAVAALTGAILTLFVPKGRESMHSRVATLAAQVGD